MPFPYAVAEPAAINKHLTVSDSERCDQVTLSSVIVRDVFLQLSNLRRDALGIREAVLKALRRCDIVRFIAPEVAGVVTVNGIAALAPREHYARVCTG